MNPTVARISGTADAGSSIKLFAQTDLSTELGTVTAAGNGSWSMDIDPSASSALVTGGKLIVGANSLVARALDGVDNTSGVSGVATLFAGNVSAPALTANQPGSNDDTVAIRGLHEGYLLSGTTDVGSVVKLTATQTISGSETRKTERTAWVEGGNWYYAVQAR